MNNNKLIAEFMGVDYVDIDSWLATNTELPYQTSWDWLMPVVSKCFKTGDDTHQWDNIMDTMFTCDINIVYAQVVEFIKAHDND